MGISSQSSVLVPRVHLRIIIGKRSRRILMKRRGRLESSRRRPYGLQRRVKTLRKLIPNSSKRSEECEGLEGLFRETADYILTLQNKVRLMQILVHVFTSGSEDHHDL